MGNNAPAIKLGGAVIALDERIFTTAAIVGSPATNAEVIVASLTISQDLVVTEGVLLAGFIAITQGTDGTHYNFRIRKTDASGTILKATGAIELAATKLASGVLLAFDTTPTVPGQVYVLTATMTGASAASTVSATTLAALVI